MKSILIIVPYDEVYPPMNGGMQRCFNIIHQLAKYFNLTLIINQHKAAFLKSVTNYPAIANVKVYSTHDVPAIKDVFNFGPRKFQKSLRYRWLKKQLNGPADDMFLQYYSVLVKLLKQQTFDIVILENLASLNAVSVIRKYDKQVKIIYDAHNVDSNLAAVGAIKWALNEEELLLINKVQQSLSENVNAILACSKNDLDDFIEMNKNSLPGVVIPNGVSVANSLVEEGVKMQKPEYILFCGILWSTPNTEGLHWFYKNSWPVVQKSFPGLKLLVVGGGKLPADMEALYADSSLQFTGAVEDVKPWYNKAAIAIVPLLSGSGTRLKILEAMSLGLPVISTSKGAEGISYTDGANIIIADKEVEFAHEVMSLLNDKDKRKAIQQSARKLVEEQYDWDVIGTTLSTYLNTELYKKEITF